MLKKCSRCNKTEEEVEFATSYKDQYCRKCRNEYNKEWRKRKKDRLENKTRSISVDDILKEFDISIIELVEGDLDDIKSKYRKLSFDNHPDRNGCKRRSSELNQMWEIIKEVRMKNKVKGKK